MQVDLTLAVNYLPACLCLIKVLALMLFISLIPQQTELQWYPTLACLLYTDRLFTKNIIFDGNAILLAVFFSNVSSALRSHSKYAGPWFLLAIMHLSWVVGCFQLILEPQYMYAMWDRRHWIHALLPTGGMITMISGLTWLYAEPEPLATRTLRAVFFAILALAWCALPPRHTSENAGLTEGMHRVYVVGVRSSQGIEYLKDTSSQFISRLAPVLYSPVWGAFLFTVLASGALVHQYMRLTDPFAFCTEDEEQGPGPTPRAPPMPPPEVLRPPSRTDPDPSLEELFRMAKQSQARLTPIPE